MKNQNLIFAAMLAAAFADDMRAAPLDFCAKMRSCVVCSAENPAQDFPVFTTGLNSGLSAQRGGISWIALMKCEIEFTDIEDVAEWNTKIGSDILSSFKTAISREARQRRLTPLYWGRAALVW